MSSEVSDYHHCVLLWGKVDEKNLEKEQIITVVRGYSHE